MIRPLVVLLLSASLWPSSVHACSCLSLRSPGAGQRWERPWLGRQVVFTGYVIETDQIVDTTKRTVVHYVRFVTEASWRGPLPDTVTLFVDANAPCAQYQPGWRYLVTSDWDPRARTRLTTAGCEYSLGADWPVAKRLRAELGPPGWTAPAPWTGGLDKRAHRLGTPIPTSPGGKRVAFIPPRGDSIVQFEIGDFQGISHPGSGAILYPEPGLYQVRVTWANGVQFRGYVSIRCEHRIDGGACLVARNFTGLRDPS